PKGLPLGFEGSAIILSEGKEDELLSAWLVMRRGCRVEIVSKAVDESFFKPLEKWNNFQKFKVHDFAELKDLVEKNFCEAIISSETVFDSVKLLELKEFGLQNNLAVFFPLVFLGEEKISEIKEIIFGEENGKN
ncbi:MAG: hypothetical protein Q7K42_01500, partial [Candidatus Diapherotrites archaeon]|nr:hypothetical protein [Candidatus Diapherotrites archaeon]